MDRPLILLTGASGFIGSHLARALAPDCRLRCPVRPGSVSRVPKHPNIEIVPMDLRDRAALAAACEGVNIIIHAAACLRTAKPDEIFAVNAGVTEQLAAEYASRGMEYFIYLSSENALRLDLTDAYPESKRRAEAAVRKLKNHLILNPCFVYGPGDHHGLGRVADTVRRLPVFPLFGGLKARVQPIYIDDFVPMAVTALRRRVTGTFTIAGSEAADLNTLARKIAASRGWRRLFIPIPQFVWRTAAAVFGRVPGAGWGPAQYANIYDAVTRDPEPAIRAFGIRPRSIDQAFKDWAAADVCDIV